MFARESMVTIPLPVLGCFPSSHLELGDRNWLICSHRGSMRTQTTWLSVQLDKHNLNSNWPGTSFEVRMEASGTGSRYRRKESYEKQVWKLTPVRSRFRRNFGVCWPGSINISLVAPKEPRIPTFSGSRSGSWGGQIKRCDCLRSRSLRACLQRLERNRSKRDWREKSLKEPDQKTAGIRKDRC